MSNDNNTPSISSLAAQLNANPDCVAAQHRLMEARMNRSIELDLTVSPEDAELLYQHTWGLTRGYAQAWVEVNGKMLSIGLHKMVHSRMTGRELSSYARRDHVRHISNENKLDCRRENIHAATGATRNQRELNRKTQKNNSSGVSGVCWSKKSSKWLLSLKIDGKQVAFGFYTDLDEAKFVRDALVGYRMQCCEQGMNRDDTITSMKLLKDNARKAWSSLGLNDDVSMRDAA